MSDCTQCCIHNASLEVYSFNNKYDKYEKLCVHKQTMNHNFLKRQASMLNKVGHYQVLSTALG